MAVQFPSDHFLRQTEGNKTETITGKMTRDKSRRCIRRQASIPKSHVKSDQLLDFTADGSFKFLR